MHELSIAANVVEIVSEQVRQAGGGRVAAVTLRIGQLSCVHSDALEYSFALVCEGTPLAGAELRIVSLPVVIFCPECRREVELPGVQRFACPVCGTRSADIRQGRELDVDSVELLESSP